MRNTLKNKKDIDTIFSSGKSLYDKLILIKWIDSSDTKFLFAVSSKKFPRAVDRNRIKRIMRESASKLNISGKSIAIVYRGESISTFADINKSILKLINLC